MNESEQSGGLSFRIQALVFVFTLLLIFSRRPSDILHAQFYAEDGACFYSQAYNMHRLSTLFVPYASYLHLLPRIAAGLSLLLPLQWAPLLMNLAGGVIQALPVAALLSRRCSSWGPLPARIAMAAVYIANSNALEVHVNVTNAQWHFALLQVLLAFTPPPRTWLGKVADCLVFLLGAFTGPFGIGLLPLVLVFWWIRRQRWSLVVAGCLAIGVVVQVHALLADTRMPPQPLGANLMLFLRLIGGDVIINAIVGQSSMGHLSALIICVAVLFGVTMIAAALRWGTLGYRFFVAYSAIWLLAALRRPMILGPKPLWQALLDDPGGRYFFFPTIVFLWAAIYCAMRAPARTFRVAGYATLLLTLFGTVRKWEYDAYPDRRFALYAEEVQQAKHGDHIIIPIHPEWKMELVRR